MSTTKHYDGTVALKFDAAKHRYTGNDQPFKGVTTITGKVFPFSNLWWAATMASDHFKLNVNPGVALDERQIADLAVAMQRAHIANRDSAASAGSMVHALIQDHLQGKATPLIANEGMRLAFEATLAWLAQYKVTDLHVEEPRCSLNQKLAGTPDLICKLDGVRTIIDWKTGSGIYYSQLIQMGLYAIMWEEEFDLPIEQMIIVNCSVKNPFKTFTADFDYSSEIIDRAWDAIKIYNALEDFDKKLNTTTGVDIITS